MLRFKLPAGTSRGILTEKESSFLFVEEDGIVGIGECSTIPNLSIDFEPGYCGKLEEVIKIINSQEEVDYESLRNYPSIIFGLETALLDLKTGGIHTLMNTSFSRGETGIPINGLVWMGNRTFMEEQIRDKIESGFRCIKLKIGSLEFDEELQMLKDIRKNFKPSELEIRLDANGAFGMGKALENIKYLSEYTVHSLEQPIAKGNWDDMAELCTLSPIPIALDEELTGIFSLDDKQHLLETIKPAYIILKPSMLGGFKSSDEWIRLAEQHNIGWWATSALESNIGLNAIAQWISSLPILLPQGLGTGKLYVNNFQSPLEIAGDKLFYRPQNSWNLQSILK